MELHKKALTFTKKGLETDGLGYTAELLVKEKLWRFGYAVKHLTKTDKYDLLVEDTFRVEVKCGKFRTKKDGTFFWNIMNPYRGDYDVLAVVLPKPDHDDTVLFYKKSKVKSLVQNGKVGKYGMTFSTTGHKKWLIELGEKSPYAVFGFPSSKKLSTPLPIDTKL